MYTALSACEIQHQCHFEVIQATVLMSCGSMLMSSECVSLKANMETCMHTEQEHSTLCRSDVTDEVKVCKAGIQTHRETYEGTTRDQNRQNVTTKRIYD